MIAALLTRLAASPWVQSALRYGAIVLAVLLFRIRFGGPVSEWGASANALRQRRKPMTHNEGCSRRRRVALGLVTIWLSGCATGASDGSRLGACPPVVEYSREFQARVAEELAPLPHGSAIGEMLSDFAVMRDQARACIEGG